MSSLAALLVHLIDYAGLFPPASLNIKEAVEKYVEYHRSHNGWILGRFVLEAEMLEEFIAAAEPPGSEMTWSLSVLASSHLDRDLKSIVRVNESPNFKIDSVEMKVKSNAEIRDAAKKVPRELALYFEIPVDGSLDALLGAVRATKRHAKIRTGGLTPDAIPSSENIARFLIACASENVAFKATAGLHHPLRSAHRLTYEPDAPAGLMHGFLNVFLAAAWIHDGLELEPAIELLEETHEASFSFGADEVRWRSRSLGIDRLIDARKNFAHSFGSCSFDEPIDDLKSLGLL
jgi:hypothetical protein